MTGYLVLTMDDCKWCDKAKDALTAAGKTYTTVNLSDNPELYAIMRTLGAKTVPQVLKVIGGYVDTAAHLDDGAG